MKEKNYEIKKINSKFEIVKNNDGTYEFKITGKKDIDNFYLKLNRFGSGTYNMARQPVFDVLDSYNKQLKSLKKDKK